MAVKFKNTININDQYTFPTTVGTDGQYLSITDAAAGTLDWTDAASVAGALIIEKNEFTGDGTDVTFTLSSAIQSESQTQVYIDGVYQSKDNYTTSGGVITFSEAPDTGTSIEVIHLLSVNGTVYLDDFVGNGDTSQYTLSKSISAENNTQVYFDGVYQSKSTYSVSGNVITFSENVPNGVAIEVVHIVPVSTGDGITKGTTAERPSSPEDGFTRYNTDTKKLELYNGIGWFNVGPDYVFTADTTLLTADSTVTVDSTTF